jgi:chromosome segregation ATPase
VYGDDGGDGWVTPERYELLEADGFSGRAEPSATTFERLRAELEDYDPALGPAGRELAQAHDARIHAQELVAAFDDVKPRRDPVEAPLRELARLVRVEAATARRAHAHAREAETAATRERELERELAKARERNEQLTREVEELRRQADEAALEQQQLERQKSRRFGPRR